MLYSLNVAINENRNIWILPADILSEDIPWTLSDTSAERFAFMEQLQWIFHPDLQVLDMLQGLVSPQQTTDVCQVLGDHLMKGSNRAPSPLFLSQRNTFAEQEEQKNELWAPNKHSTQVNLLSSCILLRQIAYFHC